MENFKHPFLQDMAQRGLVHQCSNPSGLDDYLMGTPTPTAYIGFDCTAPSLHVGSLLPIMTLRRFQQAGGKVLIVLGGGTTLIGDPSGKDKTREMLSPAQIESNIKSLGKIFEQFLDMDKVEMLNNYDWLKGISYIDFLRDFGKHFSVNRMLTMDSVRLRLERAQPLSFIEFNYMLVQAYDFAHLAQHFDCRLQMGGSDQWGNIVHGVELGRRVGTPELFALTMPLITTQDGAKMGKTAAGAVWLNDDDATAPDYSLSPYHYWQFWRNSRDADVPAFLRIFTELPLSEIEKLEKLEGEELNEAKKVLANAATTLAHGATAAARAAAAAQKSFEEGGVSENLPQTIITQSQLDEGLGVLTAFVLAGLAPSNSEARRTVRGGGAKVNDTLVGDEKMILRAENVRAGFIKLALGKKKIALLKIRA